ncbi:MAG: (d)CMP kinase, partial [bacterium]
MKKKFVIAVDGASATGKSTISKLIASEFDLSYLDTGAIYRCVALVAKEQKISFDEDSKLKIICETLPLKFEFINGVNHVFLGTRDVSEDIRIPEMSMLASSVSALPVVRASLLDMQRRLAKETPKIGSLVDGRDIGTVVFPDADVKIFLTASDEVRATRRYKELKEKGLEVEYADVLEQTIQRDKQDSQRAIAPLKRAQDAIEINTNKMGIDAEKNKVLS